MEDLKTLLRRCDSCKGVLKYKGSGTYVCESCGKEILDDFGKVKQYLNLHGNATQYQIHIDTGVSMGVIGQFVKQSRLECTENSGVFFKCESCGVAIKSGNICSLCASRDNPKFVGSIVGDVPKSVGRMRYISEKRK